MKVHRGHLVGESLKVDPDARKVTLKEALDEYGSITQATYHRSTGCGDLELPLDQPWELAEGHIEDQVITDYICVKALLTRGGDNLGVIGGRESSGHIAWRRGDAVSQRVAHHNIISAGNGRWADLRKRQNTVRAWGWG